MAGETTIDQKTLPIMISVLQEVQNAVRAYDTKAQVVNIAFVFPLGLITTVGILAPDPTKYSLTIVILSWLSLSGIMPIVTFGLVIYLSRNMVPKLGYKGNLERSYYLLEERFPMLDDYLEAQ